MDTIEEIGSIAKNPQTHHGTITGLRYTLGRIADCHYHILSPPECITCDPECFPDCLILDAFRIVDTGCRSFQDSVRM